MLNCVRLGENLHFVTLGNKSRNTNFLESVINEIRPKLPNSLFSVSYLPSNLPPYTKLFMALELGFFKQMFCFSFLYTEQKCLYLRNRSALAVNCCLIIHCLEVSCKEDQITSAKIKSTIHALELIYFNSNTQKTMKTHLKSSASSNFPPLH